VSQIIPTTTDLIVDSLFLIGELAVTETPDAFMLRTGLQLINATLNMWSADSIYIPYLKKLNFTFTPGKDVYLVGNGPGVDIVSDRVVDLTFANYFLPTAGDTQLSYPIQVITRTQYFNVVRQTNVTTRPAFIMLNPQETHSVLTVYPKPDQPYPCELNIKCMLNSVTQQQSLEGLPPQYYLTFQYLLARQFASYYPSANWTPLMEEDYQKYMWALEAANDIDLTIRPSFILTGPSPFYWQTILSYG